MSDGWIVLIFALSPIAVGIAGHVVGAWMDRRTPPAPTYRVVDLFDYVFGDIGIPQDQLREMRTRYDRERRKWEMLR